MAHCAAGGNFDLSTESVIINLERGFMQIGTHRINGLFFSLTAWKNQNRDGPQDADDGWGRIYVMWGIYGGHKS